MAVQWVGRTIINQVNMNEEVKAFKDYHAGLVSL
jgi:hypothetical protein